MRFRVFCIFLAFVAPALAQRPVADWTVLVYMSADNDLERPGMKNLEEMARAGSTAKMNVVVQIDRADRDHLLQRNILARLQADGGAQVQENLRILLDQLDDRSDGDWTGARRYHIQAGRRDAVTDLGEVDMGDPKELAAFLRWGIETYPARKYFLVLWGHGSGIAPFEKLVDQVMTNFGQYAGIIHGTRTVALDNTSDDQLEIEEVVQVLRGDEVRGLLAQGRDSDRLDLLGFDACLMGQLEVMHALAPATRVFVGSESLVPVAGWAYEDTLRWLGRELDAGRAVEPEALARQLVDRTIPLPNVFEVVGKAIAGAFISLFGGKAPDRQITLAAVTIDREQALERTVDTLAADLTARLADPSPVAFLRAVTEAKDDAQTFLFEQFIDLFHFGALLAEKVPDRALADRLKRDLDPARTVLLHRYEGDLNEDSRGVSIFFPVIDYSLLVPDDWYDRTAFAQSNRWREFVRAYLRTYRTYRLGLHIDRMAEKIDAELDEDELERRRSDASIRYLAQAIEGDLFVAMVAEKPWKASALLVPLLPYRKRIKEEYPAVTAMLKELESQLGALAESASADKQGEIAMLRAQAAALAADDSLPPGAVIANPRLDHVMFGTFSQGPVADFVRRYKGVSHNPWNWDANRYRKAVLKTVEYWDSVLGGLAGRTDAEAIATRAQLTAMRSEIGTILPRKDDPDEYWHYPKAAEHLLRMWERHKSGNRLESLIRARDPAAATPAAPLAPAGATDRGDFQEDGPRTRSRDPADADSELRGR
jgi:hypothetical protein